MTFASAPAEAGRVRYTVASGDTLLGIALEYGVSVRDIRGWNNLSNDNIFVGQTLTIRTSGSSSDRVREEYEVRSGDTGLGIARRLRVSWADLQRWNRGTNFDRLSIGQTLYYFVDGGGSTRSAGAPNRGRLHNGTMLEAGAGYTVRNSNRAWGNDLTVRAIQNGIGRVQARFVSAPGVIVHDVSQERGGRLPPHASHQNGRDADIILYRTNCTDNMCGWQSVDADELNVELQWYLFRTWIQAGFVEYIFLDRHLQVPLYEYARDRGASEAELDEWFEYPNGGGIIRHEPGHDDHLHVRFVEP